MRPLRVLAGSIGFFTAIPAGNGEKFDEFLNHLEVIPLTGTIVGGILGLITYILSSFDRLLILFPIVYLLIEGINHIDGLADFADGIYASGDRENKIRAMKDVNTGVGGITAVIMYFFLITYSIFVIESPLQKLLALTLSQTYSKLGMLLLLGSGKPAHSGLADMFIRKINTVKIITGISIAVLVSTIWIPESIYGLILSIFITFTVLKLAKKHFGGISGDTAGALNCIVFASELLLFGAIS